MKANDNLLLRQTWSTINNPGWRNGALTVHSVPSLAPQLLPVAGEQGQTWPQKRRQGGGLWGAKPGLPLGGRTAASGDMGSQGHQCSHSPAPTLSLRAQALSLSLSLSHSSFLLSCNCHSAYANLSVLQTMGFQRVSVSWHFLLVESGDRRWGVARRSKGHQRSHVHFSKLVLSGRKCSCWPGGVPPDLRTLNSSLILFTEPSMCRMQWDGDMCVVLNQPGLGQSPKLGKVERNPASPLFFLVQWKRSSGHAGLWGWTMEVWGWIMAPQKISWSPNSQNLGTWTYWEMRMLQIR